jgi:hypothetical protein
MAKFNFILLILALIGIVGMISFVAALSPNGATVSPGTPMTAPNDSAGNASAMAGNITELTISGFSTTQAWQGYFGNVSGVIQLADSNRKVMYNWSLAQPGGEVYASTNSSVIWTNIQCFNFTAVGNLTVDGEVSGETSKNGYNLTMLQAMYGISESDGDTVNNTFVYLGAANGHNAFYTANKQFIAGECPNTRIFDSNGVGTDGDFEEVLLYEPTSTSTVFASLIEKGGTNGFDSQTHNFEMLVLENGHNGDVSATTYYFFVELE